MPTTRKKVIKTVYKDDDDSEVENAGGDFSDSGSEAEIPDHSSSEGEVEAEASSEEEFEEEETSAKRTKSSKPQSKPRVRKTKFAKEFVNKIHQQSSAGDEELTPVPFSVKDLTEEAKLLPFLNLSESDSSDDESPKPSSKQQESASSSFLQSQLSDSDNDTPTEYKDVWAQNLPDNSEEVAKRTFLELEQHKSKLEETKASILKYKASQSKQSETSDVKDLLALGEEIIDTKPVVKKIKKRKKLRDDSDSDMEDWEEVKEAREVPQQGIQLIVDFPDAVAKKSKKLDLEMMMKRRINRVKKEYQVYMHKVHILCWLGHGNHVSKVLNEQEILAAALSLVPSKECYPGERVDMKYLEQITTWYKDKLTLKQDKNEHKFRPKAPPLKEILLAQIKSKTVTIKKYLVYIFVSMLRAIGLQCRVMFNFVALPIKPPTSELCSLSTKPKDKSTSNVKADVKSNAEQKDTKKKTCSGSKKNTKEKLPQVDGSYDMSYSSDSDMENIMQLDGNDDDLLAKSRSRRANKNLKKSADDENEDVSPPKRTRNNVSPKATKKTEARADKAPKQKRSLKQNQKIEVKDTIDKEIKDRKSQNTEMEVDEEKPTIPSPRKTRTSSKTMNKSNVPKSLSTKKETLTDKQQNTPKITVTNEKAVTKTIVSSQYFDDEKSTAKKSLSLRKKSQTANPETSKSAEKVETKPVKPKARTKSAPGSNVETSKYFNRTDNMPTETKKSNSRQSKKDQALEDQQRVSHKDLLSKSKKNPKNDVTGDLVNLIKTRVREAKEESSRGKAKGKVKQESDDDSDHLPVEKPRRKRSQSDDDFKPAVKISPKPRPSTSKKIDRRVLSSSSEETPINKCDVWCEVFVEELEQWISVDVIKAKIHCPNEIYSRATHPVCYVMGWDNNNYLKDLTRRYVPHWNTVTRKQRAEPSWWDKAVKPWLGPNNPRDREEDEQLNRMQLEAPLPKSIAEYKNHPLYALKRHLLKFEALYPPDAATLGFVRGEAVYSRDCVHVCRSRDTWLKEAKVVRLKEQPYKVVKARPKWDKLSNKLITDKPLEVFGPWQVQDYEPPVAENGLVPRNAYGNVELFKACMLPKGTVHLKLAGLNRVAKKLNIDCAPAMTGFDFNGGWSHPVYDGYVVCEEFAEIITDAWLKDQEEQERRELEKLESRVYGNWKRLIKGLLIRERLKHKYGFKEPTAAPDKKKKGPKLVVKKK